MRRLSHSRDVRRDLLLGEVAHNLAERLVLGRQLEGHRQRLSRLLDVNVNVKQDSDGRHDEGCRRSWTVGELADELGVTTRTLRFYEAEGLIAPERDGTGRASTASATAPGCG